MWSRANVLVIAGSGTRTVAILATCVIPFSMMPWPRLARDVFPFVGASRSEAHRVAMRVGSSALGFTAIEAIYARGYVPMMLPAALPRLPAG